MQCPFFHFDLKPFHHHHGQDSSNATPTEPLPPYTNLPGPTPQEFFAELMKSQGAEYHLTLSKFMQQYGNSPNFPKGIIKVPNAQDPTKFDISVASPELTAVVYQKPIFYTRPVNNFFYYAYANASEADKSKVAAEVEEWRQSYGTKGHLGIAQRNGELQQIQRRMAWNMFNTPQVVDNYYLQANTAAKELLQAFETARQASKDSAISIYEPFGEYTLTTIVRSAFGEDAVNPSTPDGSKFFSAVRSFFTAATMYNAIPYPYQESPQLAELRTNLESLRVAYLALVERRKTQPDHYDFVSALLKATDQQTGTKIEPIEVLTDMMDVINGGTDPTKAILTFGLHILAHYPEHIKEIVKEYDRHIKPSKSNEVNIQPSDLDKLTFLDHVIKELLRLFAVVPINGRMPAADTDLAGFSVPAHTTVMVQTWDVNHDAQAWKKPLEFNPGRWGKLSQKLHKYNKYAWVPYGSGARSCLGEFISQHVAKIALLHVLKNYYVTLAPEDVGKEYVIPPTLTAVTLRPATPLRVTLKPKAHL
eukprot:TRINITY_DN3667_c0_g3_i1.p1 TRINITY_DN3667_c0_g3~~TRINITY_DN3667_c0_g3_i1.p1  ORF type:complete len:533 (-),score=92.89 TRINITY_DN3667_c0_g3_i1:251-1849(-)